MIIYQLHDRTELFEVIAGFISGAKAENLQRFANHMSAAPGGPVVVRPHIFQEFVLRRCSGF